MAWERLIVEQSRADPRSVGSDSATGSVTARTETAKEVDSPSHPANVKPQGKRVDAEGGITSHSEFGPGGQEFPEIQKEQHAFASVGEIPTVLSRSPLAQRRSKEAVKAMIRAFHRAIEEYIIVEPPDANAWSIEGDELVRISDNWCWLLSELSYADFIM